MRAVTVNEVPAEPALAVHPIMAAPDPKTLSALAAEAVSGTARVPVTATCPPDQVGEAFGAFRAGTLGKIAVSVA